MKFKIGNKVKVKANCKYEGREGVAYAGKEGNVLLASRDQRSWPYLVSFDGGIEDYFSARELEKVEEG